MVTVGLLFPNIILSVGILLVHNHPSGKLEASQPDKDITKKIKLAAQLFDVKVLDHIIMAPNGEYFSFADQGLL